VKAWFISLAPRERLMVSAAAAVVFLALGYLVVWDPLNSRLTHAQQSVDEQQSLKRWMQQAAAEAKQLRGAAVGRGDAGRSLLAVVDQTSKQSQLGPAVKRIQPDGQDLVRVSLEQASFDDLVLWLGSLQSAYGVSIVDAAIDRQSDAGRVNARLTLKKVGS
jgi:general secretion pathway protein M